MGADLGYQHANDGERIRKKKKRLAGSLRAQICGREKEEKIKEGRGLGLGLGL